MVNDPVEEGPMRYEHLALPNGVRLVQAKCFREEAWG
jgi:hypothetical protein